MIIFPHANLNTCSLLAFARQWQAWVTRYHPVAAHDHWERFILPVLHCKAVWSDMVFTGRRPGLDCMCRDLVREDGYRDTMQPSNQFFALNVKWVEKVDKGAVNPRPGHAMVHGARLTRAFLVKVGSYE
jgi:hypothetical protein